MKRFIFVLISIPSIVFASDIMSIFDRADRSIGSPATASPASCTDFTGVWAGLCKEYFNGQLTQTYGWTHTVEQHLCASLKWDGDEFVFGGVNQYNHTAKDDSYYRTMSFSLAGNAKDTLVLNTSNHGLELATGDQALYSGQGTAKILGGKLNTVVDAHFYFFTGGVSSNSIGKTVCVMDRVH